MDSVIQDLQLHVETIERDRGLYEVARFGDRADAVETITFDVIQRIDGLVSGGSGLDTLRALRQRAVGLRTGLEAVDEILIEDFRANIRSGRYVGAELRRQIHAVVGDSPDTPPRDDAGYDHLDEFVYRLLLRRPAPEETREREPEMVYYQPSAARVILHLVDLARITAKDVLYDLGSGLGQVVILVHLLTGAAAKGVEFEPAYCAYATECATALDLTDVEFINQDAREADYSTGTIFFMYTPFEGRLLQRVLERLKREAQQRPIRVGTYGPCTLEVCKQSWLQCLDQGPPHMHRLAVFSSNPPEGS